MATITIINATDLVSASRTVINTNFSNLNTAKVDGAAALTTAGRLVEVASSGVATQTSFASSAVLLSTGTYSDPAWLTALATTKLTGTLQAAQFPALTGDITTSAGALATTLANTAVTPASYGSATQVATFTVDSKGRLTAAASTSIAIAASQVTSGTLAIAQGGTGAATLAGAGIVVGSASLTTANALPIVASAGTLGQSDVSLSSGVFSRAGTLGLSATGANVITFSTNGVERGRWSSGGDFLAGSYITLGSNGRIIAGGSIMGGENNLFIGINVGASSVGGGNNTGVGIDALNTLTTGLSNTGIGYDSLWRISTGGGNSGLGAQSGFYNEIGTYNTYVGAESGKGVSGNSYDHATFVGAQTGYSITTGGDNTFLGYQAGFLVTTGGNNVLVGKGAGDNITIGSGNVIIGTDQEAPSATASNQLNIAGLIYGTIGSKRVMVNTSADDGESVLQLTDAVNATGSFTAIKITKGAEYGFTRIGQYHVSAGDYGLVINDGQIVINKGTGNILMGGVAEGNYRLDVQSSGSTGTARIFDQTATTGVTSLVVRAGAGQSTTALQTWQNNAGSTVTAITSAGDIQLRDGGYIFAYATGTVNIGDTGDTINVMSKLGVNGTGIGFFGVTPVARAAALTAADASALTSSDATVIANMRTRIGELETKLQAYGLLQ